MEGIAEESERGPRTHATSRLSVRYFPSQRALGAPKFEEMSWSIPSAEALEKPRNK